MSKLTLTPEELSGYDLQAIKRAIGRPFSQAMEAEDEMALYAFIWRAEVRENGALSFEDVLERPLREIMEMWSGMLEGEDDASGKPVAGGGTIEPVSATSGE